MNRVILILAGFFLIPVAWSWLGATRAAPASRASKPQPYGVEYALGVSPPFSASTSCSASACHGNGSLGTPGGEQTTWAGSLRGQSDPHRQAYNVLFNDASRRMIDLLNASRPKDQQLPPASTNSLCLKCHALDHDKHYDGLPLGDRVLTEGVSCDSCHGASAKWLSAHYETGWSTLSSREKFDEFGFRPLKNLTTRSMTCAQCHIGDRDREVNHDLIAAGHPRLAFESARFHFDPNYLTHWREKLPQPEFELRAWYIGQWVNLRSALAVLEARARDSKVKPWPEFAEGSCYACHQTLGETRTNRTAPGRAAGTVPWQPWYTTLAELLPQLHTFLVNEDAIPGEVTQDLLAPIREIRKEMEKSRPNSERVAELASLARERLDAWLARLQSSEDRGHFRSVTPDSAREMGHRLVVSALRDPDWDAIAQHQLGLAAIYHATGGKTGPLRDWQPALDRLRSALAFEKNYASPRRYDPESATAALQDLLRITKRTSP